jgi:hypothetical protein
MADVDLNPVRARIARCIEECQDSSITTRLKVLENTPERLREALQPLVSGIGTGEPRFTMTVADYIDHLRRLTVVPESGQDSDEQRRWFNRVAAFKKRQRVYGLAGDLKDFVLRHGYKRMVDALPD